MRSRLNLVLAVLVVACGGSLWWASRGTPAAAPRPPLPERAAPVSFVAPDEAPPIRVLVLNGTGRSGLAGEASRLVNRLDCVAVGVANADRGDYAASLLVNRRLSDARAADLARRLGGVRVIREFDDRRDEDVVLVMGADADRVLAAAAAAAERAVASRGGGTK